MDTENLTFTKPQMNSSDKCDPLPTIDEFPVQRAKLLFGYYRRGDANDSKTFVAASAVVLARYDRELIIEVIGVLTGIHNSEKFRSFPPNVGELKAYCDDRANRRARIQQLKNVPRPNFNLRQLTNSRDRPAGSRANLLVRRGAPAYDAMIERSATADPADFLATDEGIRVPLSWRS
jgi:hypothetical protein